MNGYSANAQKARAFLLRRYNDIDIYVEDCTAQNMYVRLVNRALRGRAHIDNVFPLGDRTQVLQACSQDQDSGSRPRLYIIDGDMDLLLGGKSPRLRNLYRLKVYCSENLLLSTHAILMLATEGQPNASYSELQSRLDIDTLLKNAADVLLPLFVVYAIARRLAIPTETAGYTVHRFLDDSADATTLNLRLIRARITYILRKILRASSANKYRRLRNTILDRIKKKRTDKSAYISGKTYLLVLAYLQLKRLSAVNDSFERVKVRLAEHVELDIDPSFRRALLRAVGGPIGRQSSTPAAT